MAQSLMFLWILDFCPLKNTDLSGGDMDTYVGVYTDEECMKYCTQKPECRAWTRVGLFNSCSLKNKNWGISEIKWDHTSGYRFCPGIILFKKLLRRGEKIDASF